MYVTTRPDSCFAAVQDHGILSRPAPRLQKALVLSSALNALRELASLGMMQMHRSQLPDLSWHGLMKLPETFVRSRSRGPSPNNITAGQETPCLPPFSQIAAKAQTIVCVIVFNFYVMEPWETDSIALR